MAMDHPTLLAQRAIVALAGIPAAAAAVLAVVAGVDPASAVRLMVTALVYAPVGALALSFGRPGIAAITGALAVASGWLSLTVVLAAALPAVEWLSAAVAVGVWMLRVPEAAAIGILPWLVLRGNRDPAALRWILAGFALLLVGYTRGLVPVGAAPLTDAAFVLAQGVLPLGILAGIRGDHRLGRRTIALLATVLALAFGVSAYLTVIAVAEGLGVAPEPAGAVAAGALALVFGTTARMLRVRVDALFHAPVPDARDVLTRLGERFRSHPAGGVRNIAEALRDTWHVASVEIALTGAAPVRVGDAAPHDVTAELISDGRAIGTVTLTGDPSALDGVRPVLVRTAGLITAAALLADVNEEVAATRSRIDDVRREQRRLLRDELHDGLAPALAGLGFGIAAAGTRLAAGDPGADAAIARVHDDATVLAQDVRRLARTLVPTALDQGDLEGALRELAEAVSGERMVVALEARGTDVLDPEQQLALYLMLSDAITAARRGDETGTLTASVLPGDDAVRVRVRVDATPAERPRRDVCDALRTRAAESGGSATATADGLIEAVIPR